jgi:hypothetical protein
MKFRVTLGLAFTLLLSPLVGAAGGRDVGNGGDFISSQFAFSARRTLSWLEFVAEGATFCRRWRLNAHELRRAFDETEIIVKDDMLVDNRGRVVDAIGEPGRVILSRGRWVETVYREFDMDRLVFHELLRVAGVDDDNYRISASLPAARQMGLQISESMLSETMIIDGARYLVPITSLRQHNGCSPDHCPRTSSEWVALARACNQNCVEHGYRGGMADDCVTPSATYLPAPYRARQLAGCSCTANAMLGFAMVTAGLDSSAEDSCEF